MTDDQQELAEATDPDRLAGDEGDHERDALWPGRLMAPGDVLADDEAEAVARAEERDPDTVGETEPPVDLSPEEAAMHLQPE